MRKIIIYFFIKFYKIKNFFSFVFVVQGVRVCLVVILFLGLVNLTMSYGIEPQSEEKSIKNQHDSMRRQALTKRSLKSLTLDEKIGQLFVIPACQLRGKDHFEDLQHLICERKIGGVLMKQGTAEGQRNFINELQQFSHLPLLCIQDGEWGVGMQLSDVIVFPRNLTLGAIQDFTLLFQLGQEIGKQCRLVGVHLNLAPVCDVNCHPQNPIIHTRSFGENPLQVAIRSQFVMCGIQSMGVLACAKHFPGHGGTATDSHIDLPLIQQDWQRLKNVELLPFKSLIQAGVKAVMSAHLCVEAIVEETLLPATFSRRMITDLLQMELGFNGLVISDALNMKALSKYYSPDQIALRTLLAGHDLLLYGDHIAPNVDQILRSDVPQAMTAIKNSVEKGEISEEFIDAKVSKILKIKEEISLFEGVAEECIEHLVERIHSPEAHALKRKLFQEAITVVRNESLLPLREKNIALIEWGESPVFANRMDIDRFSLSDPKLFEKAREYSCLVLSLAKLSNAPPNFGLNEQDEEILWILSGLKIPIVAVVFGTPYSLSKMPLFDGIVIAYEKQNEAQEAAADVVLGRISPKGRLPVSVFPHFALGTGLDYQSKTPPEKIRG
jgi:beta-N-acetylhexosaminidase